MVELTSDSLYLPYLNFEEQSSHPSAPGAGRFLLYVKDGVWYSVDSGGSPVAFGGMENPMTTAGDLILGGASGAPGRLAKGSDSDVLTVDPATHLPVWAAPAAGDAGALVLIEAKNTNGAAAASFDFTSIPGTYADLFLTMVLRGAYASVNADVNLLVNNDSTGHYDDHNEWYYGSSSGGQTADAASLGRLGKTSAASSPASSFGRYTIEIPGYALTTCDKQIHSRFSWRQDTGGGLFFHGFGSIRWTQTDAITRLTITCSGGNIAQYSTATLYGRS